MSLIDRRETRQSLEILTLALDSETMETFEVELTGDQIELLEKRGRRRGVESVDEYLQTLIEQFVAQMDDDQQSVDGEVEAKLESLGYL